MVVELILIFGKFAEALGQHPTSLSHPAIIFSVLNKINNLNIDASIHAVRNHRTSYISSCRA